ncbi:MAG TPA: DUF2155 domain-containing protein [Roseococcus sp.]|nr:DUF2155 domain-containing protein [Roseococcus sp.]
MRALAALLLAIYLMPGATQAAAQEWVPRRVAEIQALDKVTARVSVVRATVGEPARYGTLTILVRSCRARPPDEVPDAAAWMEISDSRVPGSGPPPAAGQPAVAAASPVVFRGWMFAESPALNMLEHPVYDLRVLACR